MGQNGIKMIKLWKNTNEWQFHINGTFFCVAVAFSPLVGAPAVQGKTDKAMARRVVDEAAHKRTSIGSDS